MASKILTAISLATLALSQSTTSEAASSSSVTASYITTSIFFPEKVTGNYAASVIAAGANDTTWAIGCMTSSSNATTSASATCAYSDSITVTAGISTFIYTYSPDAGSDSTSSNDDATTINCAVQGGTSATQAICTGSSTIDGIGVGVTSTLQSSQLLYATLTVTAGQKALASASQAAASATSTTTSTGGAAAMITASPGWRVVGIGAIGMAALGAF